MTGRIAINWDATVLIIQEVYLIHREAVTLMVHNLTNLIYIVLRRTPVNQRRQQHISLDKLHRTTHP
jgi:hypothetical protein